MLKEIIATLATICVTSGYIPQIIKGYKTKSLKDVSLSFLGIIGMGVLLWIIYSLLDNDRVFLIANIIILTFVIILISMKLHYQKGNF